MEIIAKEVITAPFRFPLQTGSSASAAEVTARE
jgi:hypothetical protein